MRIRPTARLAFIIMALVSSLALVTGLALAGTMLALEQRTHFSTAEGEDVVLAAGSYAVEAADGAMRVQLVHDSPRTDEWLLTAFKTHHTESLERPVAMTALENTDEVHLLILLPDGTGLDAIGSISGLRSRAAAPAQTLSQTQISQHLSVQQGIAKSFSPVKPGTSTFTLDPASLPPQITAYTISPAVFPVSTVLPSVWPAQPVPYLNLILKLTLAMGGGAATPYKQVRIVGFDVPLMAAGQHGYSGCFFRKNQHIGTGYLLPIDSQGRVELMAAGWLEGQGTSPGHGNCAVRVRMQLAQQNGVFGNPLDVVYLGIPVAEPTLYTISNTWSWRNLLGFQNTRFVGVCTGTSVGVKMNNLAPPSTTSYSVGIVESNNDLSLNLRSEPVGPDCQFQSKAILLPNGTRLRSMTWKTAKSGPQESTCRVCTSRDGCTYGGPSHMEEPYNRGAAIILNPESWPFGSNGVGYSITSNDRPILTPDNVIVWEEFSSPGLKTFLLPMWTRLQCGNTATNDHGIRLILDTIQLEGPPGLNIP